MKNFRNHEKEDADNYIFPILHKDFQFCHNG